jgi:heme exporter protein D
MKVIERDWQYGKYLAYDETEEIFAPTEKGVRVLPAPFFYDKKLYFELWKKYEPGDKPTFPNGGYEVVDVSGGIRSFDLDQVIIHPSVLQHKKMLDKMARRAEKEQKKRDRRSKQISKENKVKTGKRGRPALSTSEKMVRENLKEQAKVRSGGKRGRPKSTELKTVSTPKVSSGKRGRPSLTPEALARKVADKAALQKRSGGKRGRPKSSR